MTDRQAPDGGAWWWEDVAIPIARAGCELPEACRGCGRPMVETIEPAGYARDGRRAYRRWHSCPRYLVPSWKVMLLGYGYGHDSHDADVPMAAREWR